ncbi:MAG: hypothetical protein HZA54_16200 [Planctomycetes bacterium]|nr:hypothetical protein [Planctomycetota bacterium]
MSPGRISLALSGGVALLAPLVWGLGALQGAPAAAGPKSGGAFAQTLAALLTDHYGAYRSGDRKGWDAGMAPAVSVVERDAAWKPRAEAIKGWPGFDRLVPMRLVLGGVAWQGKQAVLAFDGDVVVDAEGGAVWLRNLSCVIPEEMKAGAPPPFGYAPEVLGLEAEFAALLRQAVGPTGIAWSDWTQSKEGLKGFLARLGLPEASAASLRPLDDANGGAAAASFREVKSAAGAAIDAVDFWLGEVGFVAVSGREAVGDGSARLALVGGRVYLVSGHSMRKFRNR